MKGFAILLHFQVKGIALSSHMVIALNLYEATITTRLLHCEKLDRRYYTGKVL